MKAREIWEPRVYNFEDLEGRVLNCGRGSGEIDLFEYSVKTSAERFCVEFSLGSPPSADFTPKKP